MKKKTLLTAIAVLTSTLLSAQGLGSWMQGFPPEDKDVISAVDGSFYVYPALRYSVCNMRQFIPTKVVKSPETGLYSFKSRLDPKVADVTFTPLFSSEKMTWEQALDRVNADGCIVLHKGKIVYERYSGYLTPEGTHAVMSVSKTFTGTLGALLVAEGVLDENAKVSSYVPELAESAFGDATVRNLLDMTTSLKYSEDYSDPNAEIWVYSASGNLVKPEGYSGPRNYYEYLKGVKKDPSTSHGDIFAYKTINTDALAWVISRATGKSISDLLSERIWIPLGAHQDGYYQVDPYGICFAGGGFNACLRDLAAFGEMMRLGGKFNGNRILPESMIRDITAGADASRFDTKTYPNLKGWAYRNMWWVTNNEDGAYCARGVYGQTIYIDPKAEMVIVRLASFPTASNADNDPWSLPAYQAVADYLKSK